MLTEPRVTRETKEILEQQEPQVLQDLLVPRATKAKPELLETKVTQEQREFRVQ